MEAVPTANVAEPEAEAEELTEQVQIAAKVIDDEESEAVAKAPITEKAIGPATEAEEARHCDLCDVTLKNVRGLKAHNARVHKKIPQCDGPCEELEETFTFLSDYAEEDVKYTLVETLPEEIGFDMISRVKTKDKKSADHLCTVTVVLPYDDWQWPSLTEIQAKVFRNLKRESPSSC